MRREKFNLTAVRSGLQAKEKAEKKNYTDNRFWKLSVNEEGRGLAVIRFLPDKVFQKTNGKDGLLYRKYFTHWFRYTDNDDDKVYVSNCSTTVGESCPICEKVKKYYKSSYDSDKTLGKERKRKVKFIANILVIKDPAKPENEGKIFLFDYGPMVQKMYATKMGMGDDPDDVDVDDIEYPFDWDEGCNFQMKATPGNGQIKYTYDKSKFKPTSPCFEELDDDEREEAIDKAISQLYDLSEFPAKDSFPSEKEVTKILGKTLGISSTPDSDEEEEEEEDEVVEKTSVKASKKLNVSTTQDDEEESKESKEEEDMSEEDFINSLS